MIEALRVRSFRAFFIGRLLSGTGVWCQRIAQDWLVVSLTGNAAALGVTIAVQFIPVLILGLWGGVLADRFSKRRLLLITQTSMALLALTLGILVNTHTIQLWHVFVTAALLGATTAIENPTRQAFLGEMVGSRILHQAVAADAASFQFARLIGPAVAGAAIQQVGIGTTFMATAIGCFALIVNLLRIRVVDLDTHSSVLRARGHLRVGLRFVRSDACLFWTIALVGLVSTFAINNYVIVLTAYATQIFSSNAALFGWMNSLLGVGAIIGALIASRIKATRIRPIALLALTLCVLQSAVAFVPSAVPFLALLVPIGALGTLFLTASNSLVQRSTPPAMRGRVMGVYSLVLVGGIPLGSPLIGWAVLGLGPVWGFTLGNSVAGASVLTIGVARAVGTRTHPQPGTVDDEASGPPNVRQPVIRTP